MRGARVDHPDGGVDDHRHCFARSGVGQTENRDVARVERPRAMLRILALGGRQREPLQIGPAAQPLVNLQPRGALVAVDENKGSAHIGNSRLV